MQSAVDDMRFWRSIWGLTGTEAYYIHIIYYVHTVSSSFTVLVWDSLGIEPNESGSSYRQKHWSS